MSKLKNLVDRYVKPVLTGVTLPYVANTSIRLADEQHSRMMNVDEREHRVSGFFGYTNWINSSRHTMLYCAGMGTSLGLAGGILNYAIDRLAHQNDPLVLITELGALVLGNVCSVVYESKKIKK